MNLINMMKKKVLAGGQISREEALQLAAEPDTDALAAAADKIRAAFCGDRFDMCGVLSIKNGRCSEDCRFCPQSCIAQSEIRTVPLVSKEEILRAGLQRAKQGVQHYCLVSNGRKISDDHLDKICEAAGELASQTNMKICASLGLLDAEQLQKLKEAGVSRIHNNLETSPRYFPELCTSHTYEEKKEVIRAAHDAGLEVCSGGIIGAGETMEDRIDLALEVRSLGAESVPVNLLNAYPGTPLEGQAPLDAEEVRKVFAVFRFILPEAWLRLAAGRDRLPDSGEQCFCAGSNAAITGDMLNIRGMTVEQDLRTVQSLGFRLD